MAQAQSLLTALARPATLFALALAVRLAWLAFTGVSAEATFHPDSQMFVSIAGAPIWWQGTPDRMPGYGIFLHLTTLPFGPKAYWAPLMVQTALDAAACVAIARTAERVREGSGRYAGLLAAFNPTQIVMAATLLGDALFVACLAFGFLALARLWKGERGPVAVGIWFGLALFNRAVIWPFLPVLALSMFALGRGKRGFRDAAIVVGIVATFAAPMFVRNWIVYGEPALSAQGPAHMAVWWYPLVKEAGDGTPYTVTAEEVWSRYAARGGRELPDEFKRGVILLDLAREGLATQPPIAFVKAWLLGAAINLAAPATQMIPAVMHLPRTGFYETQGATSIEKARNFLTQSSSVAYLAWLAGGALLEWPVRLLAIVGLLLALRARLTRAAAIFAILWIGFVLAVQGPVASAKYRLPIEPLAMAFAGFALATRRRAPEFPLSDAVAKR
jgi:4-amino-4-deoxy-L-arabinose transferase-like glycosyltransferase